MCTLSDSGFTQGLCLLPVFLVVWSSCTFITSYLIAVFKHDVHALFPYISETSAKSPESCIFGLMTFISACAGISTMYGRFKLVEVLSEESRPVSSFLNKSALAFGLLSCLGMCVVATFQVEVVEVVHDIGALIFFLCGIVYICLQTIISYAVSPDGASVKMCRIRLAVTVFAFVVFIPTIVCAFFTPSSDEDPEIRQLNPFHIASAACEWLLAFSFIGFFLTYIDEFKTFTLRVKTEFDRSSSPAL